MLFNLKVVSQEEYDAHIQELREQGYTGQLGVDLNRNQEEWSMREKHDDAGPRYTEDAATRGNEGENQ
jgi:cytochrome c oxidase subunit 2